jgi:hypothetical protein
MSLLCVYLPFRPGDEVCLDSNTRIQVLETISDLHVSEKDQCGAFIRDEQLLVIWEENIDEILTLCKEFESKVLRYIYQFRPGLTPVSSRPTTIYAGSSISSSGLQNEKETPMSALPGVEGRGSLMDGPTPLDLEKAVVEDEGKKTTTRPMMLYAPFYCGIATAACVCK